MWHLGRTVAWLTVVIVTALVGVLLFGRATHDPESAHQGPQGTNAEVQHKAPRSDKRTVTDEQRAKLLQRAHVWRRPKTPISRAAFEGENIDSLSCKFRIDDLGGTSPKFDCQIEGGEEIRIKYGNGPEPRAETAATRLLRTLGFGADDVTLVERLRCFGCPKEPFSVMKAVDMVRVAPLYKHIVDYDSYEDFEWVALERKMNARPVESEKTEGWALFELDAIRSDKGGAPRAHRDGLRVMAIFLAHWDNKAENQRIVCLSPEWQEGTPCPEPFLLLQDVGATFGPVKMDLDGWQAAPMWADRSTCTVSMESLPYRGATFGRATITEAGRRFIGGLLAQLSDDQVTALFTGARFGEPRGLLARTTPVAEWVRVFKQKVHSITDGPACPEP